MDNRTVSVGQTPLYHEICSSITSCRLNGRARRRTMGQTASKRPETSILEWISPILILMVLICPYGFPWVPLVPKTHYKLLESFKFTRYVARTHMQFSPMSPFQWNHYIELHDSSYVLDSRGRRGILRKESIKRKILLRSQVKFYIFYMSSAKYPCDR